MAKVPKFGSDAEIIQRILEILYWDSDRNRWNPDKEWDVEFIEMVAQQVLRSKYAKEIFG